MMPKYDKLFCSFPSPYINKSSFYGSHFCHGYEDDSDGSISCCCCCSSSSKRPFNILIATHVTVLVIKIRFMTVKFIHQQFLYVSSLVIYVSCFELFLHTTVTTNTLLAIPLSILTF